MLVAGYDLDCAVAREVFGFRTEENAEDRRYLAVVWYNDLGRRILPKLYSRDIRDAWEVVEEIQRRGFRPILMPSWHGQWQAVIYRKSEYICEGDFVESAPLAICEAALRLVEHEKASAR